MGMRRFKRLRVSVPVAVSGTDAAGHHFQQEGITANISPSGICVRGLAGPFRIGQQLSVECKGRRARFRVAWIGPPQSPCDGHIGLEDVEGARFLFPDLILPCAYAGLFMEWDPFPQAEDASPAAAPNAANPGAPTQSAPPASFPQRRSHPRYDCSGTARIWEGNQLRPFFGVLSEISLGGCYIRMASAVRAGSSLRLELTLFDRRLRLRAMVRVGEPTLGIGVEFTRVGAPEMRQLVQWIAQLRGRPQAQLAMAGTEARGAKEREVTQPRTVASSPASTPSALPRRVAVKEILGPRSGRERM